MTSNILFYSLFFCFLWSTSEETFQIGVGAGDGVEESFVLEEDWKFFRFLCLHFFKISTFGVPTFFRVSTFF
jgi:hypothetical protein